MAIYNTITLAPSGSEGWGEQEILQSGIGVFDYFYAPYEGSFMYINSGDFIQPFDLNGDEGIPIFEENLFTQLDAGAGGEIYEFGQQKGKVILEFPRNFEQNPQITPSDSYYPYSLEAPYLVGEQVVAEYTSLPSVQLQMTIQPISFGGDGNVSTLDQTADSLKDGTAKSSPVYIEMIGTSNAMLNRPTVASDYTENINRNQEVMGSDLSIYKWEKITYSSADNTITGDNINLTQYGAPTHIKWPVGLRDIYFQGTNPNSTGIPTVAQYEGNSAYLDELVQLIPNITTNGAINGASYYGGWGYFNKLIESWRHMPTLISSFFATSAGGGTNNANLQAASYLTENAGENITIYSPDSPTGQAGYFIPLNGTLSLDYIKQHLRPQVITLSNGTQEFYADVVAGRRIRLVFIGSKNVGGNAPLTHEYDGSGNSRTSQWNKFGIVEVFSYDESTDSIFVKTVHTLVVDFPSSNNPSEFLQDYVRIDELAVNSESGNWRVLYDPPIPIPEEGDLSGFDSICDFELYINQNLPDNIQERHFRAAYLGYAYTKSVRYNNSAFSSTGGGELDTLNWESEVLNQSATLGGIFFNASYNQWQTQNNTYKNDRSAFFNGSPYVEEIQNFEYCYADPTIKFNPQKFGLKYNREKQQFELEIPHIPPCIIKGIYKVF